MKLLKIVLLVFVVGLFSFTKVNEDKPSLQLALLKYNGGGDWYANPTALVNLAAFSNKFINTNFDLEYATVEVGSAELFNHPFVHILRF